MGYLSVKVNMNDWGLSTKLVSAAKKAEHAVAEQARKDTEQYVPFLNGALRNGTKVIDNKIIYPGPYARYLYNGKVMVDSETGKGPMHFVDNKGNEVIRFRKGATLRETDKNLVLAHSGIDPQAKDHWFEASKAQNLDKWKRVAAKAVEHDFE